MLVPVEDEEAQQYLPVQPSPLPEEPLHQAVEDIPEDLGEGFTPPPERLVARAARGPRQVPNRRGQETAHILVKLVKLAQDRISGGLIQADLRGLESSFLNYLVNFIM